MKILLCIWLALFGFVQANQFTFEETTKEIQAGAAAKQVTADFRFTNKSDKPIKIIKYQPTCSCISAQILDGKLLYQPGDTGMIRAEFNLDNLTGVVDKSILLWIDDDPEDKPSLTLTARIHVPVLVAIDPLTLKWDIGSEPTPKIAKITIQNDTPINILNVTCGTKGFAFKLNTIEAGKSYELAVTPENTNVPSLGVFRIETDNPIPRFHIVQLFASVMNPPAAKQP